MTKLKKGRMQNTESLIRRQCGLLALFQVSIDEPFSYCRAVCHDDDFLNKMNRLVEHIEKRLAYIKDPETIDRYERHIIILFHGS